MVVVMSRIGKQPVTIPEGVQVDVKDDVVKVKGPKGNLEQDFSDLGVTIKKDKEVTIEKNKADGAKWGLARALVANLITGVSEGFSKTLEVHGVGFKVAVAGKKLKLELGFSHTIEVDIPEGVTVKVEKDKIIFDSVDKALLGDFVANVRKLRPPEPYKGKGLRYLGEHVRMKEGKKAAGEAGAGGAA